MAVRKSSTKSSGRSGKKAGGAKPRNSLVENINRQKKAGKSRSKKDSTISAESYSQMQQGWPKSKKRKAKAKAKAKK
ncbi:hypothetical protein Pan44_20290 [Caulifigura coniformis]|uniref:Uncharacterized protein n=1 Tax=Caulifigura coniformis TaxID=2527983 RepID=A0A517SCZ8_9PLAN|nr:hypothetical protein [Caulifigura coniformis]QDT54002.1 hypothetical protein Pan44_20290 [Caulifigura coniformis]